MKGQARNKADTSFTLTDNERELIENQRNAGNFQEDIVPPLYDEPELTDDELAIQAAITELSQSAGAFVRVYREIKGKPLEFLFQSEFSEDFLGNVFERLQVDYGRGDYRIQARTGRGHLKLNRLISVGELPKSRQVTPDALPRENPANDLLAMQMRMAEQSKSDMLQMFAMMQQSTQAMITAMAGRDPVPRPDGLSIQDVLALIPLLKGDGGDGIDKLMKGIELGKQLAGEGGEGGFTTLATSALGTLAELTKNMPRQSPPPVQVQPPRPANVLTQSPVPVPVATPPDDAMADFQALGRILVNGARKSADAAVYAEIIADNLGDEAAMELCGNPVNMGTVIQAVPGLAGHESWLEQVRIAVCYLLGGDDSMDETTGTDHATTDPAVSVTGPATD